MSSVNNETRIAEFKLCKIWPDPVDPKPLTEEQLKRTRAIYKCLGTYLNTNLEQFELNFERDQNPEQEIQIWSHIAAAHQTFLQRNTDATGADAERAFKAFLLMSMGAPRTGDIPASIWESLAAIYEGR